MGIQNMQNQDAGLVLSTDPKPRLKWTPELHQRFVEAVNQLGGPDKATPKSLMRMMGIPGLTLYHLKSHLQKYRLGKSNMQSETCSDTSKQDGSDYSEDLNELNLFSEGNGINDTTQDQIKEDIRVAEALRIQMEVQRKLHEQIEVQRHLQLRIEAQGKYLQKVLKKAQETLSSYNFSSAGVENAKAELSQLVSMVSGSPFSELTETTDFSLDNLDQKRPLRGPGHSVESSLTSSESSGRREEEREVTPPLTLPLLDGPETKGLGSTKRSRSTSCDDQRDCKRSRRIDLNSQCENDIGLGPKQPIDLNSKGI